MKKKWQQLMVTICSVMACSVYGPIAARNPESTEKTVIEQQKFIDISNDTVLYDILKDATDKVKYGNRPAYYTVWMNRYKNGTIVMVIRSYKDTFDQRSNILGYTLVNGHPIVFYKGISNYNLKYADQPCPRSFKLGKFNYSDDAVEVKHYYILGDIYARFSPEAGWIWSDGKPDE